MYVCITHGCKYVSRIHLLTSPPSFSQITCGLTLVVNKHEIRVNSLDSMLSSIRSYLPLNLASQVYPECVFLMEVAFIMTGLKSNLVNSTNNSKCTTVLALSQAVSVSHRIACQSCTACCKWLLPCCTHWNTMNKHARFNSFRRACTTDYRRCGMTSRTVRCCSREYALLCESLHSQSLVWFKIHSINLK